MWRYSFARVCFNALVYSSGIPVAFSLAVFSASVSLAFPLSLVAIVFAFAEVNSFISEECY